MYLMRTIRTGLGRSFYRICDDSPIAVTRTAHPPAVTEAALESWARGSAATPVLCCAFDVRGLNNLARSSALARLKN